MTAPAARSATDIMPFSCCVAHAFGDWSEGVSHKRIRDYASALSDVAPDSLLFRTLAKQTRILLNEPSHPIGNEGIPAGLEINIAHQSHDGGANGIDDQVPHRIGDTGLPTLHVPVRCNVIGRELEDFPQDAEEHRKGNSEKTAKGRAELLR